MSTSSGRTMAVISELIFDVKNARRHSARNIDEIKRSLVTFGQHAPLVVRRSDNRVLIGNGRLQAMIELGWKEAWVYFVDDDDEMAVKRALADNRTAELAEWDDRVLKDLISSFDNIEIPGWDHEELSDILNDTPVILDIDDLLNEEDIKTASKRPSWLVARTDIVNQHVLRQAADLLRANGIEVDLSHDE